MNREYVITSPYWMIADAPGSYVSDDSESTPLSRHADDLYKLLLRRLTALEAMPEPIMEEMHSVRAIFEEYITALRLVSK